MVEGWTAVNRFLPEKPRGLVARPVPSRSSSTSRTPEVATAFGVKTTPKGDVASPVPALETL